MGPSPRTGTDAIVQPFKRKMDESQDTTVSFRYFSVVEAEASHARQRQAVPERVAGAEEPALRSEKQAETIGDTKDLKSSGGKQTSANEHTASQSRLKQTDAEATKAPPERTTPKSKRRVTFDIKVDPDDANEKNDESSPVEQSRDAEGLGCLAG